MNDDTGSWHRTSPVAALFYFGRIWQLLVRNAFQSLAPLAALVVAFGGENRLARLAFAALALFVVTVASAIARWLAFRYRIADDAVFIHDGVFHRRQLDIRYERVQAVNTTRGVVDRLFGLVNVSFDTAGSSGQEGNLPAVSLRLAAALRERVRAAPRAARAEAAEPPVEEEKLLALTPADMLRIGVSSGRVFLVFALLGPLAEMLDLELRERVEETAILEALGIAGQDAPGILFWLGAALAIMLVLFAGAVAAAFLRFHGYKLTADARALRSSGGLFTRHEHSIDRDKIQVLEASQNAVLRLFCRFRLRLRQAAGTGGGGPVFIVPVLGAGDLGHVARRVYGNEFHRLVLDPRAGDFEPVSPYYLRSRILLFGLLPAALVASLAAIVGPAALLALAWPPLAALFFRQRYRRLGVAVTADGLVLRTGLVGYRLQAQLFRKVQKLSVSQSPFQRRRNLATLQLRLAGGSVNLPFVDLASANRLRDRILLAVEDSRLPWH